MPRKIMRPKLQGRTESQRGRWRKELRYLKYLSKTAHTAHVNAHVARMQGSIQDAMIWQWASAGVYERYRELVAQLTGIPQGD